MFAIEFDRQHDVMLTRFSGGITTEELATFNDVVRIINQAEMPAIGIVDFTDAQEFDVSREAVERRGRQPQVVPGQRRIVVAPQPEVFELSRLFAAAQAFSGSDAPAVVRTLQEAETMVDAGPLHFRPMEITWLRESVVAERSWSN